MNAKPVPLPFRSGSPPRITPTDVAQFVRLDQCHRYLRLRLTERAHGQEFMREFGVSPQDPPPLMMQGGLEFEQEVFDSIKSAMPYADLRDEQAPNRNHNERVVDKAAELASGEEIVLLQPRLGGEIGGWQITGDVDILKFSRSEPGSLSALIVDVKSSETSKVEHRLQIAFYSRMLSTVFESAGIEPPEIDLGVLYHGQTATATRTEEEDARRADAKRTLGADSGYLERVDDPVQYIAAADDLVLGDGSVARRILESEFEDVPFHLTYRCDWCRYNPFCMKSAAETDDLSLIPYLSENDKQALQRAGVRTAKALSEFKESDEQHRLIVNPQHSELTAKLSTTWPVGARLDELIHRARRYRGWKGDPIQATQYLPHRGYGSLPYCDESQNPNLVRIYVDAQHDSHHDRIYMIGALVTAAERGVVFPERRREIAHCSASPVTTLEQERDLLLDWIDETLRALVELAAPDESGSKRAPIHLIFFNRFDQDLFLDALARHAATILTATPMFDFVTQLAAFDSPVATFLVDEIRELRSYPMLSQSLQSVARFLRFDWSSLRPFTKLFHERLFDYVGKFDDGDPTAPGGSPWYTSRSRFNSQIPIEYAYAAWDSLPHAQESVLDQLEPYRAVTLDDLIAFQARRLEAIEHITFDFPGNKQTTKTLFDLPELDQFNEKAATLAQALSEFVTIERHVELSGWKTARLLPPERRVLVGESLLVTYAESDQESGVALKVREAEQRRLLQEEQRRQFKEANPDAKRVTLTKEQKAESNWSIDGLPVRLEIDAGSVDCELQEVLDLNGIRQGDSVVIMPRWTVDERLPNAEQEDFTPTPKQLLYGTRAFVQGIEIERGEDQRAVRAFITVNPRQGGPGTLPGGFIFGSMTRPLKAGETYTVDVDPNDWSGYHAKKITDGLVQGGTNTLYERLAGTGKVEVNWPLAAELAQQRFLDGLTELANAGRFHVFEPSKVEYVSRHGGAPILLVQGPPGTGKSFTTAFALLARIQGAMAADIDFRVLVSCHTHAAIDVLMRNLEQAKDDLRRIQILHWATFDRCFDERLLDVPLYRYRPSRETSEGIIPLKRKTELEAGELPAVETFANRKWAVLAATPSAIYGLIEERWPGQLFDHKFADCLVLDEASQQALPTAIMSALPLRDDGRIIVVGDHRQMPPIVKHDWMSERRRTFQEFKAFESLFITLLEMEPRPPVIRFAESFRLHSDMADFLRHEIYRHDGIDFRSNKSWQLVDIAQDDPFIAAVLSYDHPLIVVTHGERASQLSNTFERDLIVEISKSLTNPDLYGEEESDGFGVVVPHRAQRAAMATEFLQFPERVGNKPVIADTVERFQGDEREVIIVSATESDPSYLLASSGFLLDPRRLTVALSRAKRKMILVASRSVLELFTPDEETFANAQLWKDLLRRTCTVPLWSGLKAGHHVEVWGNDRG